MKGWIKFLIFLASGFGFFLFTGDGSEGILLIIILSLLEFRGGGSNKYHVS